MVSYSLFEIKNFLLFICFLTVVASFSIFFFPGMYSIFVLLVRNMRKEKCTRFSVCCFADEKKHLN